MTNELDPKGESVRRAVRWISAEREAGPARPIAEIVGEAGPRFNLTPLEAEYLWDTFVLRKSAAGAPEEKKR